LKQMPEMTPHTGLKKPLESETADISVINENMDKIDSALGNLAGVPTTAKDAAGAITELHEVIQDIDAEIPDGSVTPAKLSFDPATQTELDAHTNSTSVHGATNAPTASRLIIRDAAGRAKVAAPAASDDIARLDSITKAQAGLGNVDNYGTANQAQAEAGTASNLFMTPQWTKQYVDKRLLNNIIWRINAGQPEWSVDGGTTWKGVASDLSQYPNMTYVAQSVINSPVVPGTYFELVNISGKKGYFSFAFFDTQSIGLQSRLRVTIDGVKKFEMSTGTSPGYRGAILSPSDRDAYLGNSFSAAPTNFPMNETSYSAVGTNRISYLPSPIYFNNSLLIEMISQGGIGTQIQRSLSYATN
jgi:hypothetical protein